MNKKFIITRLYFIVLTLCFSCLRDGEIVSPFSEEKKNDQRVCIALVLFCDDQFKQCVDPPDNRDYCTNAYQGCNDTVTGCISN